MLILASNCGYLFFSICTKLAIPPLECTLFVCWCFQLTQVLVCNFSSAYQSLKLTIFNFQKVTLINSTQPKYLFFFYLSIQVISWSLYAPHRVLRLLFSDNSWIGSRCRYYRVCKEIQARKSSWSKFSRTRFSWRGDIPIRSSICSSFTSQSTFSASTGSWG